MTDFLLATTRYSRFCSYNWLSIVISSKLLTCFVRFYFSKPLVNIKVLRFVF